MVAAAGGVDHAQLTELAAKAFGKLPSDGPSTAALVAAGPSHFTGSEVRIRDPDMDKLHFAVAFKGASWADPQGVALMVIQSLIGAWDKAAGAGSAASTALAQRAAVNGFADSYMAFNTNYHDAGLFGVYCTADPHKGVDDLAWSVMHELARLTYNVGADEVDRAKTALKASLLFAQDGPSGEGGGGRVGGGAWAGSGAAAARPHAPARSRAHLPPPSPFLRRGRGHWAPAARVRPPHPQGRALCTHRRRHARRAQGGGRALHL